MALASKRKRRTAPPNTPTESFVLLTLELTSYAPFLFFHSMADAQLDLFCFFLLLTYAAVVLFKKEECSERTGPASGDFVIARQKKRKDTTSAALPRLAHRDAATPAWLSERARVSTHANACAYLPRVHTRTKMCAYSVRANKSKSTTVSTT